MKVLLVSPDSVRIGDRHRKDLGDLDAHRIEHHHERRGTA